LSSPPIEFSFPLSFLPLFWQHTDTHTAYCHPQNTDTHTACCHAQQTDTHIQRTAIRNILTHT
jgi:hypothetical protein